MRGPQPCRITNTAKEIYEAVGKPEDDGMVEDRRTLLPNGEMGVLESTVKRPFLDAMADDEVDLVETNFWFTEPEGGWPGKQPSMEPLEEIEGTFPMPFHDAEDGFVINVGEEDEEMVPRAPLDVLAQHAEGEVLVGVITDQWLYHGLQVDIGAEFDGLVPMTEEMFQELPDRFLPGELVQVRVHKIMQPGLYRWPLVLQLVDEELAAFTLDPDDYWHPVNHAWAYEQGWTLEQLMKVTGREYTPASVYMRRDDADVAQEIQDMYGEDIEEYLDGTKPAEFVEDWLEYRQPVVESLAEQMVEREQ